MKTISASLFALMAATLSVNAETPRVVADIAPVHSLVEQVMEGVGTATLLMKPGVSPHGYALRPSEARALQNAGLVIWVGPQLAPQIEKSIESLAGDAHVITLLSQEPTIKFDYRGPDDFEVTAKDDHDDHGHDDHENHDDHSDHDDHDEHEGHDDHDGHEGHDHSGLDSHAWLDPENASIWLGLIAAELSEIDPENAGTYRVNAEAAQAELEEMKVEISRKLEPLRGANYMVFHDAYQYFEQRFGLKTAGAIRVGDASSPSAARLREARETLKEHHIQCIFSEPQFPDSLVASVSEGLDIHTAEVDPLGAEQDTGPALYKAVITNLADTFVDCLSHDH
ncbi:zinc ABC transporter substrate-binding protein [Shimia haliotis]|uniref:High-affinity zinc uptake system protein ZnuA n=1 Tax=Shimia haliotis TaxID=1280847 RepID=A0A1I4GGF8_9RHOB|nr:zinc ABC transporter substrate-binding protein [Shimia haliotis]SFL28241.1 zinc transport system substrate-binding protein [Shimia haliotis]